ncbi:MAG: 6-bladed beta-propeller [Longimicrobiales bacterium]
MVFALAAFVTACGGEREPDRPPYVVRDSAGIEIVESSGPLWPLGQAWQLADSPRVVIGLEDGDPRYLLDGVGGAVRLSDGRIVIANTGSVELRVYDGQGRYLQTIGRRGGGPGEFRRPDHIRRAAGDTIEVWDAMLGPISVFDPQGRYVRRENVDRDRVMDVIGLSRATERLTPLPDGTFVLHVTLRGNARERGVLPGVLYRPPLGFFRFQRDLSSVDSLGWYGGVAQMYLEISGRPVHALRPVPVHARVAGGGDPLRVYAGNGEPYEIHSFDSTGRIDRILRLTNPPVPLSAEEGARIRQRFFELNPGAEARLRRVMDAMPPQTHYPAYHGLYVDTDGCLWVATYQDGMHVFDPAGRWLGRLTMPGQPLDIGRDYVLLLARDSLMVERVKLYDLRRDAPAAR